MAGRDSKGSAIVASPSKAVETSWRPATRPKQKASTRSTVARRQGVQRQKGSRGWLRRSSMAEMAGVMLLIVGRLGGGRQGACGGSPEWAE